METKCYSTPCKKNKPSNYILPRNIVIDLSRRKPKTIHEIKLNRRINHGLIKNHGQELLQHISKGRRSTKNWPQIQYTDLARERLILAWSTCFAASCGIASDLIMPAQIAQTIAREGIQTLTGWRKKMLFNALQKFLSGNTTLGFQEGKPHIYPS